MAARGWSVASLAILLFLGGVGESWAQCAPSVPESDFIYRFGIHSSIHSDADLLGLLLNPTAIIIDAVPAPAGNPAATIATTETHALYPIAAEAMVDVLQDATALPAIIPDLARHETICRNGPNMIKQIQRTEFNFLIFTFGTEYRIDVRYALNGPVEYGSYWGMYESVDGKLASQFGSWYFRNIEIDGSPYTYVRHFTQNGVTSRLPGLRMVIKRNAGSRVAEMIDAIYREALRRSTIPMAAVNGTDTP